MTDLRSKQEGSFLSKRDKMCKGTEAGESTEREGMSSRISRSDRKSPVAFEEEG